ERLIQGRFILEPMGPKLLKGIESPIVVHRVVREADARHRFDAALAPAGLTPLVGRDRELQVLVERWEQTKRGSPQIVRLKGEPGIGKSRLVHELREHAANEASEVVQCYCSPLHTNSPLHP